MTIKEKILTYLDVKGIKRGDFFDAIGIASSNFKGNAKQSELGGDKIAKILTIYTDLSAEWLMTGRGDMLKTKHTSELFTPSEDTSLRNKDKNNKAVEQENTTEILLSIIREKDNTIQEQAEEIGRLREQIEHLERRKEKAALDAQTSGAAHAG